MVSAGQSGELFRRRTQFELHPIALSEVPFARPVSVNTP
jgi:hypothetical protein